MLGMQAQMNALRAPKAEAKQRQWLLAAQQVDVRNGCGIVGWVPCSVAATHSTPQTRDGETVASGPRTGLTRVAIGNKALMADLGLDTKAVERNKWLRGQEDRGRTGLYVAVGTNIEALLTVQDPMKPEARGTVARLMQAGVRSYSCVCMAYTGACSQVSFCRRFTPRLVLHLYCNQRYM